MTDNELLLAISGIMDKKLQPINEQLENHTRKFETIDRRFDAVDKRLDGMDKRLDRMDERLDRMDERFDAMDRRFDAMDRRLTRVELRQENEILPRLQNIEACYTSTYERYRTGLTKLDAMQADISVIKSVVSEHSEKLKKIS